MPVAVQHTQVAVIKIKRISGCFERRHLRTFCQDSSISLYISHILGMHSTLHANLGYIEFTLVSQILNNSRAFHSTYYLHKTTVFLTVAAQINYFYGESILISKGIILIPPYSRHSLCICYKIRN